MRVADGWLRGASRSPARPRLPLAMATGDQLRAQLEERAAWQALQEAGPGDHSRDAQLAWRAARYALDLAAIPATLPRPEPGTPGSREVQR